MTTYGTIQDYIAAVFNAFAAGMSGQEVQAKFTNISKLLRSQFVELLDFVLITGGGNRWNFLACAKVQNLALPTMMLVHQGVRRSGMVGQTIHVISPILPMFCPSSAQQLTTTAAQYANVSQV